MVRTFLLKFNGAACPGGILIPKASSDWENRQFRIGAHMPEANGIRSARPATGDVAYFWVNEWSGGAGLCAKAVLAEVRFEASSMHFAPMNVELLGPFGLKGIRPTSGILAKIHAYRPSHVRQLDGADERSLLSMVNKRRTPSSPRTGRPLHPVPSRSDALVDFPDEIGDTKYIEGAATTVMVNKFERDRRARDACIRRYGAVCQVCGIDFERAYGPLGRGFIHVHHLVPLTAIRKEYVVNPVRDLRPVCPNCHAMLHRRGDAMLNIESLKVLLRQKSCRCT